MQNHEKNRFRYTLEYWTHQTEWTFEKENRFWHFNTLASMLWWWNKQSGMAKYFAMHDFVWAKFIRRFGNRGTRQLVGTMSGRNSLSTYGAFFYVFSTLKMAVRNLYLHSLALVRFYESMNRLVYLRTREMEEPGFLVNSHVMRAAMTREVDNFTRHMQSTISFGEGYLDIWNEFGKCFAEFSKTADNRADEWNDEGFMAADRDKWEQLDVHTWDFQAPINWDGANRSDGGKLHLLGRIQGNLWKHYWGGYTDNAHKANRGLYHLMPQGFDYGHSFRGGRGEWNRAGDAKGNCSQQATQSNAFGFLLKFQFGTLGNKDRFRDLFNQFFYMENWNRGMSRQSFRLRNQLGDRSEELYGHCLDGGKLDPMLIDYAKHLVTLTTRAERRMFRTRVRGDRV